MNTDNNNNFTKLPNYLLKILQQNNFSSYKFRILFTIISKTYGWHKESDNISLTQFQKATNLDRRHIYKNLIDLEMMGILKIERSKHINNYKLNKNIEEWKVKNSARISTSANLGTIEVHKKAPQIVPIDAPTKEKKENIQNKEISCLDFKEERKDLIDNEESMLMKTAKGCAENKKFNCENYINKLSKLPFCKTCFNAPFWQQHNDKDICN